MNRFLLPWHSHPDFETGWPEGESTHGTIERFRGVGKKSREEKEQCRVRTEKNEGFGDEHT